MRVPPPYLQIVAQIKSELLSQAAQEPGRKLPTQAELVERFGVSRSTIVRCLTKLTEEGLIQSLQGSGIYVAEAPVVPLRGPFLSLIVPDLRPSVIIAACRGVERRARQLGYQVLLASSEYGLALEQELVEQHLRAGTKGIILYPVTRLQQELASDYLLQWQNQAPLVAMDITCKQWPCSQVLFDNYRLGYDMTQRLIAHGARRIAFLHTSQEHLHTSIHDRCKGWEQAMGEAGLEISVGYAEWPLPMLDISRLRDGFDAKTVVDSLLQLEPPPDAVIAWHDEIAANLILTLQQRGVRVPSDILVVGFDSERTINCMLLPPFPTSEPDFTRMGEMAVDILVKEEHYSPRAIYYLSVPLLWQSEALLQEPHPATPLARAERS